ncbi:unnamed protein product [Blepharisma stoltei]|uniref:Uncharacterized protein n=1 Tax=Blepharisma stoltei TaxID=1481888 RepID=A0AAU9II60_9CILI|nr:unnamed protein product [Blepharisma stoltei]
MERLFLIFILPFTTQAIHQYIVGGKVEDTVRNECEIFQYKANYKPLSIEFESGSPLYYYIISTIPSETCPKDCDPSDLYCNKSRAKKFKEIVSVCTESVYLYFVPNMDKNVVRPVNYTIKTDYLQNSPCEGFDRTPANFCKMLPADECLNNCDKGCGLLHCYYKKNMKWEEAFNMCLPDTVNSAEKKMRCEAYDKAIHHTWEGCGTEESGSAWLFWLIFFVILGSIALFLGVTVFYYRYMLKKTGRAPFTVPTFCPQLFFPRPKFDEGQALRIIQ